MKDKNLALKAAGIVFLLVAIMHLVRLLYRVRILIGGHRMPMFPSWIGFVVALGLGLWMYAASKE